MTGTLEYAVPVPRRSCRAAMIILVIGFLAVAAVGGWMVYGNFDALWGVPPGTPIRPMGLVAMDFLGSLAGLGLAAMLALASFIVGWRWKRIWLLAILLVAFGFAPGVAAFVVSNWIMSVHHLVLEP